MSTNMLMIRLMKLILHWRGKGRGKEGEGKGSEGREGERKGERRGGEGNNTRIDS